ncbi:MAG: hypothetical protein CL847_01995 [Crocinitomicaceae bacterium]|nr:hypothetical protein [Crocinitomicaceae bacterium]|tara:strand:- start:8415 stop:9062 length:648 start_codon:yes stop_codon:yes gene_type:complete
MPLRLTHLFGAIIVLGALAYGYMHYSGYVTRIKNSIKNRVYESDAISNYSKDVKSAAVEFDLSYPYLMALIQLECGGRKPAGSRFEKHVFKRLKDVRDGNRENYENVTPKHLKDASDAALKNLATSWGPFQLMGYKCILLGVKIKDIRGEEAVYYGAKWIDLAYGKRLRNEQFKDCFHIHNTGRPYPNNGRPTTHDPQYIPRGLAAIEKYKNAGK